MKLRPSIGILFIATWLTGCATTPEDSKIEIPPINDKWFSELTLEEELHPVDVGEWWKQFNDELLNQLISDAAEHNQDLAEAFANIEKAKASVDLADAGYFPNLNLNINNSRNRYSSQTGFGLNTGIRNSVSAGLEASWEPDFFGRNKHVVEAAEAQLGTSEALYEGALLSVVAEISANYFEVRGLQRQLTTTEQQIQLLKQVEDIALAQVEAGVTTKLDLMRAQGERESLEATVPNMQADMIARIYRISVLTGKAPETHLQAFEASTPLLMPSDRVPVGLRSDILKRRPDIRQAEMDLAAAIANEGIANADHFPSFSITGAIGSSVRVFSDLFTTGTITGSLAEALHWSLYTGGATSAKVDMAASESEAAKARYQQSVLLALEDAESALLRYGREWQTLKLLRNVEASRQTAAEIATLRYEAGEEPLLTVLDAERTLMTTRNNIASSETRILTNLSLLYKSLGGGWQVVE